MKDRNEVITTPPEEESRESENDSEDNKHFRPQVINGAQDFTPSKAYVAVMYMMFGLKNLLRVTYIITSLKEKISTGVESMVQSGLLMDRHPSFHQPRWQTEDIEKYLKGGKSVGLPKLFDAILNQSMELFDFMDKRWHSFLAIWIIGTYFHRMFPSYPYIHLNGNAGSGKTKCLSFIAALAFNGELSVNNTASYMIRVIHNNHATCCIDEVERLGKAKDDDSRVVLAMLNAGYKRGSFVGKSEPGIDEKWTPKRFEAYSPKVLAGIQNLHPTLASRCIPIVMLRSARVEVVNKEVDNEDAKWVVIRNELYRSLLEEFKLIQKNYNEITDSDLVGRSWELWKPILVVAKSIDEVIYHELKELAVEIEIRKKDIESSNIVTPLILKAIYEFLSGQDIQEGFLATSKVYAILVNYDNDEFGWLEDEKKKSFRGRWLTRELRIAGVIDKNTEQKKVGGVTTKGYTINRNTVAELLKRYGIKPEDLEPNKNEPMTSEEIANSIDF